MLGVSINNIHISTILQLLNAVHNFFVRSGKEIRAVGHPETSSSLNYSVVPAMEIFIWKLFQ